MRNGGLGRIGEEPGAFGGGDGDWINLKVYVSKCRQTVKREQQDVNSVNCRFKLHRKLNFSLYLMYVGF